MPLTGEASVSDTLMWRLSQVVFSVPVDVASPGIPFSPGARPYVDVSVQPNRPPGGLIGFDNVSSMQGIMQVSVHWPSGQGVVKAYQVAEDVKTKFRRGDVLSRSGGVIVRIVEEPSVGGHLLENDGRVMVPVTVYWVVW